MTEYGQPWLHRQQLQADWYLFAGRRHAFYRRRPTVIPYIHAYRAREQWTFLSNVRHCKSDICTVFVYKPTRLFIGLEIQSKNIVGGIRTVLWHMHIFRLELYVSICRNIVPRRQKATLHESNQRQGLWQARSYRSSSRMTSCGICMMTGVSGSASSVYGDPKWRFGMWRTRQQPRCCVPMNHSWKDFRWNALGRL